MPAVYTLRQGEIDETAVLYSCMSDVRLLRVSRLPPHA